MSSTQEIAGQPEQRNRENGIKVFKRRTYHRQEGGTVGNEQQEKMERGEGEVREQGDGTQVRTTPGIQADGESGRRFFHPLQFLRICWRSSSHVSKWTNVLWPFTIAAIALYFTKATEGEEKGSPKYPMWTFVTAYIGMVPAANLLGFAGQELARKIPKVIGVILETTFGSLVEIILFMVLIAGGDKNVKVIQAAILGSILANMLLCLGARQER